MAKKNITIGGVDYTQVDKVKLKETGTENYAEFTEGDGGQFDAIYIPLFHTEFDSGYYLGYPTITLNIPNLESIKQHLYYRKEPAWNYYTPTGTTMLQIPQTGLSWQYYYETNRKIIGIACKDTMKQIYYKYDGTNPQYGLELATCAASSSEGVRLLFVSHDNSSSDFLIYGDHAITRPCYLTAKGNSIKTIIPCTYSGRCCLKDTCITLSNSITKPVQDITYEDELLVWDFDNSCFSSAKPLWILEQSQALEYTKLTFGNNITLSVVGTPNKKHRIFNHDLGEFIPACQFEIGHKTFNHEGELITLIKKEDIKEEVNFYCIITDYHMNLFTDTILTSCGYNNIYPIKNMKFVKDNREIVPIEAYGDIDKKWYDGLRLGEQDLSKRSIEKAQKYIKSLELSDANRNK